MLDKLSSAFKKGFDKISGSIFLDKKTITSGYLSEKKLMDNAGRSLAQFIMEYISDPFNQHFVILAGPGNNGDDGIICHHYLMEYGANSVLLLLNNDIII